MSYHVEMPMFGFKELPDRILVREDGAHGEYKAHGVPIIDHWYMSEERTCQADETDTIECVCDGIGNYGKRLTVHVMECTECGHVYEHVNGDYEYCPRCGRKREDVSE